MKRIMEARSLVERAGPIPGLIADRGYEANHLRRFLAERQAIAVIPTTTSRSAPIPYDSEAYKQRNRIERLWCRLKDWRRLATRYDKFVANYLSDVIIAATNSRWIN